jgi:AraC-like DNA-binding protein
VSFDPKSLLREVGLNNSEQINDIVSTQPLVNGVFNPQDFPRLTSIIVEACEQANSEEQNKSLTLALSMVNLFIESQKINQTNPSLFSTRKDSVKRNSVNSIIEYIENNLDDNERLIEQKLSQNPGVSQPTLRRLFIEQTGYPPKTFIMRSRMAVAEWLLAESKLSITERPIYITTHNLSWVYDGNSHSDDTAYDESDLIKIEDTYYSLVEGHTLEIATRTSITNVWESVEGNNVLTFNVIGTEERNNENYTIEY